MHIFYYSKHVSMVYLFKYHYFEYVVNEKNSLDFYFLVKMVFFFNLSSYCKLMVKILILDPAIKGKWWNFRATGTFAFNCLCPTICWMGLKYFPTLKYLS